MRDIASNAANIGRKRAAIILTYSCRWKFNNVLPIFIVFTALAILVSVTGCISKPGDISRNETLATPVITDATPIITADKTPSTGQTQFDSPAPKELYINAGEFYQFTYHGRNITINYTSAYPTQIVKITFDGTERIIRKELTDSPNVTYWSEGKFTFNLKPVLWEIRDGQRIPFYEKTWNTTELYFKVFKLGD